MPRILYDFEINERGPGDGLGRRTHEPKNGGAPLEGAVYSNAYRCSGQCTLPSEECSRCQQYICRRCKRVFPWENGGAPRPECDECVCQIEGFHEQMRQEAYDALYDEDFERWEAYDAEGDIAFKRYESINYDLYRLTYQQTPPPDTPFWWALKHQQRNIVGTGGSALEALASMIRDEKELR